MATNRHKGRFRSEYTDDERIQLIREVTTDLRPNDPTAVTQSEFDANALRIVERLHPDWPEPPTARALWMKLTKDDDLPKRSWEQLIEVAVAARSLAHTAASATREASLPQWFEEPHIVFAVRRVWLHLHKLETVSIDQYEAGRLNLLASVRGDRREQLVLLLPSGHQLASLAEGDWNVILKLCGLPPIARGAVRGHPLTLLAWHYYETHNELPNYNRLRSLYTAQGIAVPKTVTPWSSIHDEVATRRAERGWATPPSGPAEGERLTAKELAALLADAPGRPMPHGYWTPERILDALVEYLDEFESVAALRQKHFMGVRVGRSWPNWEQIRTKLVPGRDDLRWDEAITIAQRERRRRRRAA